MQVKVVNNVTEGKNETALTAGAVSLTSGSARAFFADYLVYEHARVFRQLLVKRLTLMAVTIGVAWGLRVVPTVGLLIGFGLLLVIGVLVRLYERRARRRIDSLPF